MQAKGLLLLLFHGAVLCVDEAAGRTPRQAGDSGREKKSFVGDGGSAGAGDTRSALGLSGSRLQDFSRLGQFSPLGLGSNRGIKSSFFPVVGAIDKEKLSQNSLQEDQDHHAPPEAARGDQQPVGAMQKTLSPQSLSLNQPTMMYGNQVAAQPGSAAERLSSWPGLASYWTSQWAGKGLTAPGHAVISRPPVPQGWLTSRPPVPQGWLTSGNQIMPATDPSAAAAPRLGPVSVAAAAMAAPPPGSQAPPARGHQRLVQLPRPQRNQNSKGYFPEGQGWRQVVSPSYPTEEAKVERGPAAGISQDRLGPSINKVQGGPAAGFSQERLGPTSNKVEGGPATGFSHESNRAKGSGSEQKITNSGVAWSKQETSRGTKAGRGKESLKGQEGRQGSRGTGSELNTQRMQLKELKEGKSDKKGSKESVSAGMDGKKAEEEDQVGQVRRNTQPRDLNTQNMIQGEEPATLAGLKGIKNGQTDKEGPAASAGVQTSQADSEGLPPPADRAKKKALPTPMQLDYVDGQQDPAFHALPLSGQPSGVIHDTPTDGLFVVLVVGLTGGCVVAVIGLGYLMSSPAACPLTPASQSSTSPTFTSAKLAFRSPTDEEETGSAAGGQNFNTGQSGWREVEQGGGRVGRGGPAGQAGQPGARAPTRPTTLNTHLHANQKRYGAGTGRLESLIDLDCVEDDETIYECPGLAPPGEMVVTNPFFLSADFQDNVEDPHLAPCPVNINNNIKHGNIKSTILTN